MRKVRDKEYLDIWNQVKVQGTSIADCILLYQTIVNNKYTSVVEIGAMHGSSSVWIVKALSEVSAMTGKKARFIVVDPNFDTYGGRGGSQKADREVIVNKAIAAGDGDVEYSDKEMTSDEYFETNEDSHDLIWIDGDHSYKGCNNDIVNSKKFTKHILVHDYDHDDGVTVACDEYEGYVHNTERGIYEIIL